MNRIDYLIKSFDQVFHEFSDIESHEMCFGTDTKLTKEEAHLIKAIKEQSGSHVMGLAEIQHITKAAISVRLKQLDRKGMITKSPDPSNLSRLIVGLTEKGLIAYEGHEEFHNRFYQTMKKLFASYNVEEIDFLVEFINKSSEILEEFREKGG